jgi:hypothetical protein
MAPSEPPTDDPRIRRVTSFDELLNSPFQDGVNALCWVRELTGDFGEVVALLAAGEGITALDEATLQSLALSPAGKLAVERMLGDFRLLQEHGRLPELNAIRAYPRDEEPGAVRTDVYSFHADSAPVESDTWLCTYHGAPSEGLRNEETVRRVDVPEIRQALLEEFGGEEGEEFESYLHECCFDLHYAPLAGARPYSFGLGHLWRIAVDWPGSPVPPCIHRAPDQAPGDPPRLLLIS